MERRHSMEQGRDRRETDRGGNPFVVHMMRMARQNQNFRTALWTGCHLQMTLMHIPPCGEIGLEVHPETDQFIRVEEGQALVCMGKCKEKLDIQCRLGVGEAVFIPCGMWHNICNTENCALKLSSIYAPPHHPKGTVHCTREDAERAEKAEKKEKKENAR